MTFGRGRTISGQDASAWPEAPHSPRDLGVPDSLWAKLVPPRVEGPLKGLVGSRIHPGERSGTLDEYDPPVRNRGRIDAWPVLPLRGADFTIETPADIARALRRLLSEKLPGLDWWVPEDWLGPFEKYGMVHGSLPAPPNPATGQPMALEIFGMDSGGGIRSTAFRKAMHRWRSGKAKDEDRPPVVRYPARVIIEVATYANVAFPGFGVPFYS